MRSCLNAAVAAGVLFLGKLTIASEADSRSSEWIKYDIPSQFADPPSKVRPAYRYWVPDADVEDKVLVEDLRQMKAAGWGGAQVIPFSNYALLPNAVDPAEYGFGGSLWTEKLKTLLRAAKELDFNIDVSMGPSLGAGIPMYNPDMVGTNTELAWGVFNISSGKTFDDKLPDPDHTDQGYSNAPNFPPPPPQNFTNKFVAAVAARISTVPNADARTVNLDYESVEDITKHVENGHLTWTSPDDGHDYVIFTFWQRRTGYLVAEGGFNGTDIDNPASWYTYVVDHFSQEGTDMWTSYWDDHLMDMELLDLLKDSGVYAWEDSTEFRATLFWTDKFLEHFDEKRGYNVIRSLPVLLGTTGQPPSTVADSYFYWDFVDKKNDTNISWKLRNDYWQVLTELYETYHLEGLGKWTKKWGGKASIQCYSTDFHLEPVWDILSAAAHVDAPEVEATYYDGGGPFMGRKQVFSSELGAKLGMAYAFTSPVMVSDIAQHFTIGVNRVTSHAFPYTGQRPQAEWPGFTTFNWAFSDMWGPRMPAWEHMRDVGNWISRCQLILQNGVPRADLALYRHLYGSALGGYGDYDYIKDASVRNAGYSVYSVSPALLSLDNAIITNGLLAEDGPGFSAFVINDNKNITGDAVKRFNQYAKDGFPIVFVGDLPETTPFHSGPSDKCIKKAVQHLLTYPSVMHVDSEAELVTALKQLNVTPAAENETPGPIYYNHRWDADHHVDYYWAYNSHENNSHATIASMRGKGHPYELNPWTGIITPIVNYTKTHDRIKIYLSLAAQQNTVIALAPRHFFAEKTPTSHVVYTTADLAEYAPKTNSIILKSTSRSKQRFELSDGTKGTFGPAGDFPKPSNLGPWTLSITEWQPNPKPFENFTTVYTYKTVNLTDLVTWDRIDGFETTSGIGTYETSFEWPSNSTSGGALIDLGPVFNTVRLWVNGKQTRTVDLANPVVDIGEYIWKGKNNVTIIVASTLRNKLIEYNNTYSWQQAQYAVAFPSQSYGLSKPVTLTPYYSKKISLGGSGGYSS